MLVEVCELEKLAELQVKVTCGPHYQRVIRQQGLLQCPQGRHPHQSPALLRGRLGRTLFSSSPATGFIAAGIDASHPQRELVRGGGSVPGASSHGFRPRMPRGLGCPLRRTPGRCLPLRLSARQLRKISSRLSSLISGKIARKTSQECADADSLEGKCGLCGYRQLCGGCRARPTRYQ